MKSIGIIGFGSFGAFLAEKLDPHVRVRVSSRRLETVPEKWRSDIGEVAACDYVIPSIPLQTYETVLMQLRPLLSSRTTIVDVCSVKVLPTEIVRRILPEVRYVATHPLFGPESALNTLEGHTFIVCGDVSDPEACLQVADFARKLGLNVVDCTAEEHDREMSTVHSLTFFIAQALVDMGLGDVRLRTPSFQKLLELAELERSHSSDLFETIQAGNPFAGEVRRKFIAALDELDTQITEEQTILTMKNLKYQTEKRVAATSNVS